MAKEFKKEMLDAYLTKNPADRYAICATWGKKFKVTIIRKEQIYDLAQAGLIHGGSDGTPRIRRMCQQRLDDVIGTDYITRFTFELKYNDVAKDCHNTRAYTVERMVTNAIMNTGKYAKWIGGLKGSEIGNKSDIKIDGGFIEVKCCDGRFNMNSSKTHFYLVNREEEQKLDAIFSGRKELD